MSFFSVNKQLWKQNIKKNYATLTNIAQSNEIFATWHFINNIYLTLPQDINILKIKSIYAVYMNYD